jgi:hypothetical protein
MAVSCGSGPSSSSVNPAFVSGVRVIRSQDLLDLVVGESHEVQIEGVFLQGLQLHPEDIFIPLGTQGQAVVREHETGAASPSGGPG